MLNSGKKFRTLRDGMLSGDHFYIIDTCIIIIKYFIFTCKLQNTTPLFRECVELEQIKYYKKLGTDHLTEIQFILRQ
jgi:hypothetical protein